MSTVYKKNNNIHEVIKGREEIMPCYLTKEEEKNKKRNILCNPSSIEEKAYDFRTSAL